MPVSTPSGYLDFTNATPRATKVIATSNVGIGTSDPIYSLDVMGTANVGALTATSVDIAGGLSLDLPVATIASNLVTYDTTTGELFDSGGLFSNKLSVVSEQPPSALSGASTTVEKHGIYKVTASTGTPQNAFDKATNTSWVGSSNYGGGGGTGVYVGSTNLATGLEQGDWVAVELPYKATLRHLTLTAGDGLSTSLPEKANLYATNDTVTWTELKNWQAGETTVLVNATEPYKKYAIVTTKTAGNATLQIGQLKLFCESFSVDGGKIEMATSALTGGASVMEQTTAHGREPAVLKKYPEVGMPDYVYNGYVVSTSSDQNITREAAGNSPLVERSAWCAFDNSDNTFWQLYFPTTPYDATSPYDANSNAPVTTDVNNTQHRGHWIKLKLPNAIKLQRMTKDHGGQPERWDSVAILGSNDDTNWHVIKEFSLPLDSFTSTDINSDSAYTYILLIVKSLGTSDNNLDVFEIGYYGYEETATEGDTSLDTTIVSKYNTPDLTSASLYLDGLKGSTATDYSGRGIAVTENNVTWDSTEKSWTLSGAATSNVVSADLGLEGDQPHTVSAWVKADQLNGRGLFHVGTAEGEGDAASRVGFVDDSHISWGGEDHFFSNAEWHNVTYTYNGEGSDKKLYLDGRLVGTAANEDTFGDYPPFAMSDYSQYGYTASFSSAHDSVPWHMWGYDETSATDQYGWTTPFVNGGGGVARYDVTTGVVRDGGSGIPNLSGTYQGEYAKLELPYKLVLSSIMIRARASQGVMAPRDFKVFGSNDETNWVEVLSETGATPSVSADTSFYTAHTQENGYKYLALVINKIQPNNTHGQLSLRTLKFFGHRENDLVRFPDPTNVLKYPHVAMTGPAQRGYVVTGSTYSQAVDTDAPWKSFDGVTGDNTKVWKTHEMYTTAGVYSPSSYSRTASSITDTTSTQHSGEYLVLETPRKLILSRWEVRAEYAPRRIVDYAILGSNTNSSDANKTGWTLLTSGTFAAQTDVTATVSSPTTAFKYHAIVVKSVTNIADSRRSQVNEMKLYGTEEDLDVVARIGDGYDGKVRNLRVFSTALSQDRVQEIFDADKDEFGLAKSSVSVYRGHLGIGTTEPKVALTVMDEIGELEEFPPRAMTDYETYMDGHGVFKASVSEEYAQTIAGNASGDEAWLNFDKTRSNWTGGNSYTGTGNTYAGAHTSGGYGGDYIELKLPYKIRLQQFIIQPSAGLLNRWSKSGVVVAKNASHDTWTNIFSWSGSSVSSVDAYSPVYFRGVDATNAYDTFRLVITSVDSQPYVTLWQWRLFGTREQGASTLHNGELTLTRNLTVPRIGPALDADDTPRRDRLVVEYNTSTNPTENGVVKDTSGSGLDGLMYNDASYDATEKALVFDGTDDYIENYIKNPAGAWIHTFSLWVKPTETSTGETILQLGNHSANDCSTLRIENGTIFRWFFHSNDITYTNPLIVGGWYHVVAAYDGGSVAASRRLWVNGVEIAQASSQTPAALTLPENAKLRIGGQTGYNYFGGSISNFKLYDVAITADEVKRLYDMGRCDEGHHVVNFSKTRVGIGLGDGEVPQAALDVRGSALFGGNVGVGVTNPSATLHIKRSDAPSGTITADDYYFLLGQNENGVGKEWRIGFGYNISTTNVPPAYIGYHEENNSSSTYGDLVFGARTNGTGSTQATEHMRITHDGNVGIGTTNPTAKLHVNGSFYAPGSVIQCQTRTFGLSYSTTSTTYTYSGAYVSITPKFANSKMFVMFDGLIYISTASGSAGMGLIAYKSINGGTDQLVYSGEQYTGGRADAHNIALYVSSTPNYLHSRTFLSFGDSSNTTSSITYKIYARSQVSGKNTQLGNGGHQPVTFTVFEIAQ